MQFTDNDIRRLQNALTWVESMKRNPGPPARRGFPVAPGADVQIVRVSSATPSGQNYPGTVDQYDANANTHTDLGTVNVVEANSKALTTQFYLGRRVGDQAGVATFEVVAGGIGSASPALTGTVTVTDTGLGTSTTPGLNVTNTTAAGAGSQQVSPSTQWTGQGWATGSGGSSQSVQFQAYVLPVQGAANPTGVWHLQVSVNGAAYADVLTVDSAGNLGACVVPAALVNGALGVANLPALQTPALGSTLAPSAEPTAYKFTIPFNNATLAGLNATSGSVTLCVLPAGAALLMPVKLYHTAAFTGTGLTALTVGVQSSGGTNYSTSPRAVQTAPADPPTFGTSNMPDGRQATTLTVVAFFNETGGGTLNHLTAGSVDIELLAAQMG